MWIDSDQIGRIDNAMFNENLTLTLDRSNEYWSDAIRRFLLQHNARYGETKISYNPYQWRRELIFNTEQDAIKFCLKVL
jgi:hypothetical protein